MEQNEQHGRFSWPITWWEGAQWPAFRQTQEWQLRMSLSSRFEKLDLRSYMPWPAFNQEQADVAAEMAGDEMDNLTQEIARHIQPVAPSLYYRRQLKSALLATHRQNAAQRTLFQPFDAAPSISWPLIATVPVVLGIATLIWRRTQRSAVTDLADAA